MRFRILLIALTLAVALPSAHVFGQDWRTGYNAYRRGDYAEALKIFRALADRGHAGAHNQIGLMYVRGRGVPQDYAEGVKWFREAAARGSRIGLYNLGFSYYRGHGVAKDSIEAEKWTRMAAERGYAKAQYLLGYMYYYGEGITKNNMAAVSWLRRAALQGYVRAYRQLGRIFNNQDSEPQDYVQAFVWYTLALESGQKFPRAEELKDRIEMNLAHEDMAKARKMIEEIKAQVRASKRR